jgi:citrate synthase
MRSGRSPYSSSACAIQPAVRATAKIVSAALEEYGERPLRMRPSGLYSGPRPPQPLPE